MILICPSAQNICENIFSDVYCSKYYSRNISVPYAISSIVSQCPVEVLCDFYQYYSYFCFLLVEYIMFTLNSSLYTKCVEHELSESNKCDDRATVPVLPILLL